MICTQRPRSSKFDKDYEEVAGEVAGGISLPDECPAATQQGAGVPPEMQPEMQRGSMDLEMLRLQRPTWMSEEQAVKEQAGAVDVRPVLGRLESVDHKLAAGAQADSAAN